MAELTDGADLRETVRKRYAAAAARGSARTGSCCSPAPGEPSGHGACCTPPPLDTTDEGGTEVFGAALYDAVDASTVSLSLGCGVPTAVADLQAGETVLDLGSGAGGDVLLSARRVGPTGRAIGLDMTDEMLALARAKATQAGVDNVEFLQGYLEQIPLPNASVDVVISNCVINLAADKDVVLREAARVLGRVAGSRSPT